MLGFNSFGTAFKLPVPLPGAVLLCYHSGTAWHLPGLRAASKVLQFPGEAFKETWKQKKFFSLGGLNHPRVNKMREAAPAVGAAGDG